MKCKYNTTRMKWKRILAQGESNVYTLPVYWDRFSNFLDDIKNVMLCDPDDSTLFGQTIIALDNDYTDLSNIIIADKHVANLIKGIYREDFSPLIKELKKSVRLHSTRAFYHYNRGTASKTYTTIETYADIDEVCENLVDKMYNLLFVSGQVLMTSNGRWKVFNEINEKILAIKERLYDIIDRRGGIHA